MYATVAGSPEGDEVVFQQGDIILTSLRLIVSGLPLRYSSPAGVETRLEARPGADPYAIVMFLLRDIVEVKFEYPVIGLKVEDYVKETSVQISMAYPGASVMSALGGVVLPNYSTEDILRANELNLYHRELDAKSVIAERAIHEFFLEVVERNLRHGIVTKVY